MEAETNSLEDAPAMAFCLHQVTHQTSAENVLPAESLIEVQNQENANIKHRSLEGETKEINPTDTIIKEQEKVLESHTGEDLENEDDGKFKQEKAKETEEATELQLLKTATDRPPEEKVQSTTPTSDIVKGDTEEISQQQTHKKDETAVIDTDKSSTEECELEDDGKFNKEEAKAIEETTKTQLLNTATESLPGEEVQPRLAIFAASAQHNNAQNIQQQPLHQDESQVIDNGKSCIAENEHDKMSTVIEEPEQPETKDNVSTVIEEQACHKSEESNMQSVITNCITEEGHVTPKSSKELADVVDADEQKTVESLLVENLDNKSANEITTEEATDAKQSTDAEIPKSETKGVSEDKALQTLPSTASIGIEAVDESCQEDMQQQSEFDVTYAKEEQTPQHEFDAKKEIIEEETCQLNAENEPKSESQPAAQNEDTTSIKNPFMASETAEINPTGDTKEQEEDSSFHAKEKLAIKDDDKIYQEEAKGTEEETKIQLLNTATESVPKDKALQTIAKAGLVRNEAADDSSQEERQPEEEFTEQFNKEVQIPQFDTEETSEINIINNVENQQEIPAYQAKDKQRVEDNGNLDQEEAREIEEATKMQSPEEEAHTTLPTPAFVQGDTDQISQQQSPHNDELESIGNGKSCIPEIEHDGNYTVVEEPDQPENKDNVGIVTEEQEGHQSEESSLQSIITNYIAVEGPVTSQISTKLSEDVDDNEQKTIGSCNEDNSQNKDARDITAEEATDAKQLTDVDIPKSEIEDVPEDKVFQTIPNAASVGKEAVDDSSQERQPEAEFTEKFNKDDTEETAKINTINDTKEQEVPAYHESKKLGIEDDEKFDEEEAKGTEEVQTTLPTPAFFQGDAEQILQQQTLHNDESEAIDDAKNSIPEIEHEGKSTSFEESEQHETKDNIGIVKEEQASHQSEDNVDAIEVKTVESCSVENLENQDTSEITTDAKKSTDVEISQLETEGLHEDKALQTILDKASVGNEADDEKSKMDRQTEADDEKSKKDRQTEAEFTEKYNEVKTPPNDNNETAEINTTNDTETQEEIPASHAKEKLGTEYDGNFNQEDAEGTKEATKMELYEEEIRTTIPAAVFVEDDNNEILQQQTLQDDESDEIHIVKNICTPETELGRKSSVIQEPEQHEIKDNIGIVKQEQADHQSEESINAGSIEKLEDKDACEIRTEQSTDSKQLIDVEIPNSETNGVSEDKSLQPTLQNEAVDKSSQEERQLEAEFTEKFNKVVQTPQIEIEETAEINTNDTEKQKEVQASHAKEKLGIEDDSKFNQEGKGIEEAKIMQLPHEEVQTTLHTAAFVEGDTDQIPQQQTLHSDESEAIRIAKNIFSPEIEHGQNCTVAEEPEKPETKDNICIVKEEKENHLSEELILSTVSTYYTTAEGHVTSESSTKLTEDVDIDEQKIVDTHSLENSEKKNACETIAEKAILAKQLTEAEIPKTENEAVHEDKDQKTIIHETSVGNEAVDETNQEETLPEAEFTDKFNIDVQTPQIDTEETAEINTTNDAEKHEDIPASHAKEKQGIEDDGNYNQEEEKGIGEETTTQLPEEEVHTTLPTPVFIQGDNDQTLQQQTLHDDDSEATVIVKNICTPEIELGGMSTVVEELEKPETKDNISIVKEEQADNQSKESSMSSVITNYTTAEGHVTSESSTKLTDDVDIGEQKIGDTQSKGNLENKDACEIVADKAIDAKQLTNVDIPKKETEGVPEDTALQTIPHIASIRNEAVDESIQEDRQPEAELTEKFHEEGQTQQIEIEETAEINTTNDTEKQDEVQASHAKEKLGTEDDNKFGQEEDKEIKEAAIMQLPEVATAAIVKGDTDQIPQQKILHDDESEAIDIAKNICTQEIELGPKSIVLQECEQPETKGNVGIVKEQADHQSLESSVPSVIINYTTAGEEVTSENSTKLNDDVDADQQKTVDSPTVENLKNKDTSQISEEEATDAKLLTDEKIPKSETEGVPEDKSFQTIPETTSVGNEALHGSSQEERKPERQLTQKNNELVQTPQIDTEETAEINTINDTETQEEVPVFHAKEMLGIEDNGNFDREEAKGTEEDTKMQIPEEEVLTTLPVASFVQCDTDQILQQQTLHDHESEVIDIANNSCKLEIELDRKSTVIKECEQPETKDSISIEKEQADHQSVESSVASVITNDRTADKDVISERSTKLTADVIFDELESIDSRSAENIANKHASEISAEEAVEAKQSIDVEIPKSQTKAGVPENKAMQTILDKASVQNKEVDDSRQEERQPEAEFKEKFNEEVQTLQIEIEETAEINTTNDTEKKKRDEVQSSHAKKTFGIEDDNKFYQEEGKGIEEATIMQLPEEEVQTTLTTAAFVKVDTDQILQQQTMHNAESEAIDIAKNISTPEIELDQNSIGVEECEQPETKNNVGIVKEQADHQLVESCRPSVIVNYNTAEGKVKSETEVEPEDKPSQTIPEIASVGHEALHESSKEEREQEAEFTEKIKEVVQTPQIDTEDTAAINTINDIETREAVPVTHAKEMLGIEDNGNFDQEAKGTEEDTKMQIPEEEVLTTLPLASFVQCDTDQIPQQQTLQKSEVIDIASNICKLETELDRKSTVVKECEEPETKDSVSIEKEQAEHQSVEPEYIISERSTKLTDYVIFDEPETIDSHSAENLEIKHASEISAEEAVEAKQSTDVETPKSQTEGVPEDKAMQTILDKASVKNQIVDEAESIEKFNEEVQVQTLQIEIEETAEINNTNDTEKQKQDEVKPSHAKEKLGIEDDKKFNQEEGKAIEEATITELPEEEVQTSLSTAAFVKGDTDQILQQQTLHDAESEAIDIAKNICTPETELDQKSIIIEECEQPEIKDNVGIVKEQADHQLVESCMPSVIINYTTAEGEVTSETEGVPEDKSLQTIPKTASVGNEALHEGTQEERQPEAEFTQMIKEVVQTPQIDTEDTAAINTINDIETREEVPTSQAKEMLGIEDNANFDQEEAKGIEEDTKTQLPEEEVLTTLPTAAFVQDDTDQILQQQTLHDRESELNDISKHICTPEIELGQISTVAEEPEQPETKANASIAKEEQADHQSQESSLESVITNYITAEKVSDDVYVNEQKTVESHSVEVSENTDASKIRAEGTDSKQWTDVEIQKSETDGPAEKEVQPKLDAPATVQCNTDQNLQQQTLHHDESEAIDNAKRCIPENELDRMSTVVEEPDQPETKASVGIVKEEQSGHQSQESSMQSVITNYITSESSTKLNYDVNEQKIVDSQLVENLENKDTSKITTEEATDAKQLTDVEIQKLEGDDSCPAPIEEKLVIKDDGKFDQEEAQGIEEATKTLLLNTAAKSPSEEEVQEILPTPAIAQGDTKQTIQQQTLYNDESKAIDKAKSCIPENEYDRKLIVIEEPGQPETKANVGTIKEEEADNQSQLSNMQSVITNYITAEGHLASETSTKLSYTNEQKTVDSQLLENFEIKDASKIEAEKVNNAKQLTDVQIQKSETEDVPEDKALQTLVNAASVGNEAVDESRQKEIQPEEFEVTYTKEVQTPRYEFNAKKDIPEEETCQLTVENEQKSQSQPAVQTEETTFIKYPYSDGETAKINPTNDIEEQVDILVSPAKEKLGVEDDGIFDQGEAKGIEEATKAQLLNTATESVPDDKVQTTLPTSIIVKGETVEGIVQEQTLEEEEPAAINNKSGRPENELGRMANIVETIDQHETMTKVSAENEEHAHDHYEQSSMENVITKHINSEGTVTTENSTKSSYNVEEQELEKVLDSKSIENSEIKEGEKIFPEEASNMKEPTDVPEDKAMSTLPNIASVKVEIVDESIQEALMQKEAEPEVTNTKEVQGAENDFVKNMEIFEAFDLHKAPGNTSLENEKKTEVQSEAKSREIIIKHPNLEGPDTAETSPSNGTEELEKEHQVLTFTGISESVQTDTGKPETPEAETAQLGSTREDEAGDEFEKISPSSSVSLISRESQDSDNTKVSQKKSHGILSGVGSKVKHSISKVKKAITGKSSHTKTPPSSK